MSATGYPRPPLTIAASRSWRSRAGWVVAVLALVLVSATHSPGQATPDAQAARLPEISQPLTDLAGVVDAAAARGIEQLSRTLLAASGDGGHDLVGVFEANVGEDAVRVLRAACRRGQRDARA